MYSISGPIIPSLDIINETIIYSKNQRPVSNCASFPEAISYCLESHQILNTISSPYEHHEHHQNSAMFHT